MSKTCCYPHAIGGLDENLPCSAWATPLEELQQRGVSWQLGIGRKQPDAIFQISPERVCFARAADGRMVELAFTREDAERIWDLQHQTQRSNEAPFLVLQVFCEILARELPRQKPV